MQRFERASASGDGSRAELIASNSTAIGAFALTRLTMAIVVLATLALRGFDTSESALLAVQVMAGVVATIAIGLSGFSLFLRERARNIYANNAWGFVLFDAILSVGVMAMVDSETSPLAWVALIAPVLETAVLFSMVSAGFIWLGISLAFLALRLATNTADDATTETLVLSLQQVVAVLFVAGPAALMADSAQQRIDKLTAARRTADTTSKRLRLVTKSAHEMSKTESSDEILRIATRSAVSLGFAQADVVIRDDADILTVHSTNAVGTPVHIPAEILTSQLVDDVTSLTEDDSTYGQTLHMSGVVSGNAISVSGEEDETEPKVVLRVWNSERTASPEALRALVLLAAHASEVYRANQLLNKAQAHADQLQHEVRHDGLTGLANRNFIIETLELRLAQREPLAIFFIDLDGFKSVNDTLGHRFGDEALIEVASRLLASGRTGELAGRMGGDEFILLVPLTSFDTLDTLRSYGEQIVNDLSGQVDVDDKVIGLGASVGIAVHDGALDADQLINLADHAMYEAKRSTNSVQISPETVALFSMRSAS